MFNLTHKIGIRTRKITDPYYNNLALLMNMNGENSSTSFVDSSKNNARFTVNGNAQISTAQSKFNNASALFDGNGDSINATSNNFQILNGDFTVELFIFRLGNTGESNRTQTLIGSSSPSSTAHQRWDLNITRFSLNQNPGVYIGTNGTVYSQTSENLINNNSWYHIAATRSGNTYRIFIDGIQRSTSTNSSLNSTNNVLRIGAGNAGQFHGYIDEVRLTIGVARYTSNFTPPNAPFFP